MLGSGSGRTHGYGFQYNLGAGTVTISTKADAQTSSLTQVYIVQGAPANSQGPQETDPSIFGTANKATNSGSNGATFSMSYTVPTGQEGTYTIYFYDANTGARTATFQSISGCFR